MEANISRSRKARLGRLTGLAAIVALVAVACGSSHVTPRTIYITLPPSSPTPTASVVTSPGPGGSATPTPAATPGAVAPTVSSTTVTSTAPDGRWTVAFEKPVVGGVATAAAMNTSITTKVNAYISSFTGSGLPAVSPPDGKSTLEGSFTVAYVSPSLLSLRFSVSTYVSGAAHPVTEIGSINFNVLAGTVIQLPDLFTSTAAALPVMTARAHALLVTELGSDLTWPASVTMAEFGKAWVFTSGGLEVGWSQGELASMAAGPVSVVVPWAQLAAVIVNPGPAAGFLAAH
jgi:hypothetical protein